MTNKKIRKLSLDTKLSDVPSEIITQALSELAKAERTKCVSINVATYFRHDGCDKCEVCMAGAVMLRRTKVLRDYNGEKEICVGPYNYARKECNKLTFISEFQFGLLRDSLQTIGLKIPPGLESTFHVPAYKSDPTGYKRALRLMAAKLKRRGM